ncbi:unnamed protein product [marine sediment metagenome]|uniref:Uncharacterized protein n=1 Tax=marine sediment metagenome TaxID=412755 RepID=X1VEK2_9ZZZZ
MPFTTKPDGEKKFGENTRVLSIRIPESQFEYIKTNINDFVDNYTENNPQKIETIQDGIEEIVSMYLDIKDYVKKEKSITLSKYYSILFNHNKDLIVDLIDKFPIERKTSVKTLTEEETGKDLTKEERIRAISGLHMTPLTPRYGSPGYEKNIDKLMKRARKKKRK